MSKVNARWKVERVEVGLWGEFGAVAKDSMQVSDFSETCVYPRYNMYKEKKQDQLCIAS